MSSVYLQHMPSQAAISFKCKRAKRAVPEWESYTWFFKLCLLLNFFGRFKQDNFSMTGVQLNVINGLIDAFVNSPGLCPLIPKMWVEHGSDRICCDNDLVHLIIQQQKHYMHGTWGSLAPRAAKHRKYPDGNRSSAVVRDTSRPQPFTPGHDVRPLFHFF